MTSIYKSSINIAILLCLTPLLAQTALAQTVFQGSTWSEFPGGAEAACADDDIDNDNDGLIELCYLEDVNAIRYVLDGSGYQSSSTATKVTTGCALAGGTETCQGYELVRDLDFDDDDSYIGTANKVTWTTGAGWQMIAGNFSNTLEGNGHTISNLFMDRTAFINSPAGFIENNIGGIYNLGLSDINMSITILGESGAHTAALVGSVNQGVIANCYIQGKIKYQGGSDLSSSTSASLAAENRDSIINSYSNVNMSVTHHRLYGMFVGYTDTNSLISNSYAIGSITRSSSFVHSHDGNLTASYTNMGGTESVYPLAQWPFGPISRSYWDSSKWMSTQKPTRSNIVNSKGFSTDELQVATAPNNVDPNKPYYQWSEDNWDFGTSKQYPALRHARGNNDSLPACGTSQQPACGALLPGQSVVPVDNSRPKIAPQQDITIKEGETSIVRLEVSDEDVNDELSLLLSTLDKTKDFIEFTPAKIEVSTNNQVIRAPQMLTIKGIKAGEATLSLVAIDNTGIRNTTSAEVWLKVTVESNAVPEVIAPASVTVREGREATFNVTVSDGNVADVLTLEMTAADPDQDFVELVTTNVVAATNNAETRAMQTFKIRGLKEGTATLQIVADDGLAKSQPAVVNVIVAANAVPKVTAPASVTVREGREATFNATVSDGNVADVLTLELTATNPSQDVIELVTRTVRVATNSTETRAVQTFKIRGLKQGTATLQIVADDGLAQSQPAAVNVTVKRNSTPTITITPEPLDISLLKGTSATFNVTATDADADDTDIRVQVLSKHSTIAIAKLGMDEGSGYPLSIEAKEVGRAEIEVSANDRRGTANSEATKTFEVVVSENQAPMAVIQNVTTQVVTIGETLSLETSDFFEDPDDAELSYEVSGFPDGYNFSFSATGTLAVTPGIEDASKNKLGLPLTVKATDSGGSSAQAMFTLLVDDETDATIRIRDVSKRQLRAEISDERDENGIVERKHQWFIAEPNHLPEKYTEIPGATTPTYWIKDNNRERAVGTKYRVEVTFIDNIGQEVILPSTNVYTVENEAPVIDSVMPTKQNYDEGERVSVTTSASDANNDVLTYTWSVTSRDKNPSILENVTTNTESISFRVPPDWIDNPSTATGVTETLQLEIAVTEMRDGGETTTQTATVVVTKKNNGNADIPSISVDPNNPNLFTFQQVNIDKDPDGINDGDSNLKYQWQQCSAGADCSPGGNWQDIGSPITDTTNPLSLIPSTSGGVGDKFRVKITYTDGQGYNENLLSGTEEYTADPAVKIRAKVFLEGPLQ